MAYHADYWVVAGTAAPVMILTSFVTINSVALGGWRTRARAIPEAAQVDLRQTGRFALVSAALGFLLSLVALAQALWALGTEHDRSVLLSSGFLVSALLFLFVANAWTVRLGMAEIYFGLHKGRKGPPTS